MTNNEINTIIRYYLITKLMEEDDLEKAKKDLTPDNGFDLVGIDYFAEA